jgi:hypothetical protein
VDPLATTAKAGVGHGAARTVVIEIPTQSGELVETASATNLMLGTGVAIPVGNTRPLT